MIVGWRERRAANKINHKKNTLRKKKENHTRFGN